MASSTKQRKSLAETREAVSKQGTTQTAEFGPLLALTERCFTGLNESDEEEKKEEGKKS